MNRVIVVGAGVIGLTCAVRLLEEGYDVDVLARDLPLETTSAVAGAICLPYRAYPVERVQPWTARSRQVFEELAGPDTGVFLRPGTHLQSSPSEVVAPIVEMPVYLVWLEQRVKELGGTLTRMALQGLPEHAELVVNAAGLGARLTAQDLGVVPVRGQVVLVQQFGLERWFVDTDGPTFVIPRSHDVVVGGTAEDGEWDRRPSEAVSAEILARATAYVPELKRARVVGHRVGLRPARSTVRLEREGRVIHCYGHGGAGVTLSWGCADEVVALAAG